MANGSRFEPRIAGALLLLTGCYLSHGVGEGDGSRDASTADSTTDSVAFDVPRRDVTVDAPFRDGMTPDGLSADGMTPDGAFPRDGATQDTSRPLDGSVQDIGPDTAVFVDAGSPDGAVLTGSCRSEGPRMLHWLFDFLAEAYSSGERCILFYDPGFCPRPSESDRHCLLYGQTTNSPGPTPSMLGPNDYPGLPVGFRLPEAWCQYQVISFQRDACGHGPNTELGIITAVGDHDGDGVLSEFRMALYTDEDNQLQHGPVEQRSPEE